MQKKYLPALLLLSLISTCLEVDISVPGFPQIARFFNVSEGTIQLTIAYNFFGFCFGALLYGPLSESFGRRTMMLLGNTILLAGALGCVFAYSINFLLLSRLIQGIGASTSVVLVFAMIADAYEGSAAMKLIGLMNASLASLMAIAPIFGGFINQAIGWRGNYGFVALMCAVTWILLFFFLPETKRSLEKFHIKHIVRDYARLVSHGEFISSALVPSLLFAAYMSYIAASSFLYMGTFQLSVIQFVIYQAIIVAAFAIPSMLAAKIITRVGPLNTVKIGISFCCVSASTLLILGSLNSLTPYTNTAFMCLFSLGFAMLYPVVFSHSLSIFPTLHGTASSIIMAIRALLVSGFTALTGFLYNSEPIMVAIPISLGIFLSTAFVFKLFLSGKLSAQPAVGG